MNASQSRNQGESTTSTRRLLLRAAGGGLVLAASGLLVPAWLEEAEAREGALDGAKGGRRGKDHRGRNKKRSHGNKKDKNKDQDKPRGGDPLFRSTALTVVNKSAQPLQCTFYYRTKTGLDDYGLPIANGTQTINPNQSYRYDPDRYRVGVLIKQILGPNDLYADVRNVSFYYPRGGAYTGPNLDPHNNTGAALIAEQNFAQDEEHQEQNVVLKRLFDDSKGPRRIEWELTIR